jgi:hypothetical protein
VLQVFKEQQDLQGQQAQVDHKVLQVVKVLRVVRVLLDHKDKQEPLVSLVLQEPLVVKVLLV